MADCYLKDFAFRMGTVHLRLLIALCLGLQKSTTEILQRQKRTWIVESFIMNEDYKGPFPYSLGMIPKERNVTLVNISGQGVDRDPIGLLQINGVTGEITVNHPVVYKEFPRLKVTFEAIVGDIHQKTELCILINIREENNPPKFDFERYEISIAEATKQATELITITATDNDMESGNNIFDLKIVSVTPEPRNMKFYLIHKIKSGTISFTGCVDRERAEKYTVIVEAKDRGVKQQSNTCTIIINIKDGNKHLPEITGYIGHGRVRELEENVLVARVQVTDKDSKGSPAWRAKYEIQGDVNHNFRITTDPETNEGLLYVEKHLKYLDGPVRNVTITVKNEIPYQTCKVVRIRKDSLWDVVISGANTSTATGKELLSQHTQEVTVTVTVEDVNEPPIFDESVKRVLQAENVEGGQYLGTFTARDLDFNGTNTIVFRKGDDPADWVTVDPVTGKITTSKSLDRESHFVNGSLYTVLIYAVDNGEPPMTGTATLSIHISDRNDNAPTLHVNTIHMCQSDGPSMANITVSDMDEEPYTGPFSFKLLGDVVGKWRVEPHQGYSVNLVKENTVHSGKYKLVLEVSDLQLKTAVHNLSVIVCNCLQTGSPECVSSRTVTLGAAALGIICCSIFLLVGIPIFLMSYKGKIKKTNSVFLDDCPGHLMKHSTETPGTDCKVTGYWLQDRRQTASLRENYEWQKSLQSSMGASSLRRKSHPEDYTKNSMHGNYIFPNSQRWMEDKNYFAKYLVHRRTLFKVLNTMLHKLQTAEEDLGDYAPHVYAMEGDSETDNELDAISIPDVLFDPDLDLNVKFSTLASICLSSQSTAYTTENTDTRVNDNI